jgi:hypothetical protein
MKKACHRMAVRCGKPPPSATGSFRGEGRNVRFLASPLKHTSASARSSQAGSPPPLRFRGGPGQRITTDSPPLAASHAIGRYRIPPARRWADHAGGASIPLPIGPTPRLRPHVANERIKPRRWHSDPSEGHVWCKMSGHQWEALAAGQSASPVCSYRPKANTTHDALP